ncbi:hypothetical protein KW113_05790 [Methylococcus capsulatus]|nr:hypothetical protein KW112_04000 [Methylococcus capsulatus]QXP94685.1 hypothetical protein KW113_05790 [Methylococcus capsulatus]
MTEPPRLFARCGITGTPRVSRERVYDYILGFGETRCKSGMNEDRKDRLEPDSAAALRRLLEKAAARGVADYIESRKAKIPGFVAQHFSFRGAWEMHKKTLGRDYYRIPVNLLWSLPAFLSHSTAAIAQKLGAKDLACRLRKVPSGLPTALQSELNWLIHVELLELPYSDGSRRSTKDALLETILSDPELSARLAEYLGAIRSRAGSGEFRASLAARLQEYGKIRQTATELAASIATLAGGYAAFGRMTPGAASAGSAAAAAIAQQIAIANFWLGPTLGAWYYTMFPADVSFTLIAASTGAVMAALGILGALSAVVVDPLLAMTGFHRKRLERFVESLAPVLAGREDEGYRVHDHYLARLFDLFDLLRLAAQP